MAKPPLKGRAPRKEPRQPRKKGAKAIARVVSERAYHTSFPGIVKVLAFRGDTDADIYGTLGVHETTFYRWLKLHPALRRALDEGRMDHGQADARVRLSLYERATGYSHAEERIFNHKGEILRAETVKQYPPDTAAIEFWLTNRAGDKWKRKTETTLGGELNLSLRRALLDLPED